MTGELHQTGPRTDLTEQHTHLFHTGSETKTSKSKEIMKLVFLNPGNAGVRKIDSMNSGSGPNVLN